MGIAVAGAEALELKKDVEDGCALIDSTLGSDMARQHPVEVPRTLAVVVVNPARKLPAELFEKLVRDMK
ncbi:MAG: hypothetical protein KA354_11765 [Phycisphaerae bacterium]|nr:hypothetical protein [Phycisphaerae bacterium]